MSINNKIGANRHAENHSQSILITGGSGFIGTHLCQKLKNQGHQVRVLDLLPPKKAISGVDYRIGDVRVQKALEDALTGIDSVFHLAATVSIPLCEENPKESYSNNVLGTKAVLEALKKISPKTKLIFASSAAVYGKLGDSGESLKEGNVPEKFLSFYASQKYEAETILRAFHREHQIPSLCFRFFNVFGPGQDPRSPYSGVITLFETKAIAHEDLNIFGDGEQTRDFISVSDLVACLEKCLHIPEKHFWNGQAINLGSGVQLTINALAKDIIARLESKSKILHLKERPGDIRHSKADISQAKTWGLL